MTLLQHGGCVVIIGVLVFLLVDGWLTQAVWVRGSGSTGQWVYKQDKDSKPRAYWLAMTFYGFMLMLVVGWLLFVA